MPQTRIERTTSTPQKTQPSKTTRKVRTVEDWSKVLKFEQFSEEKSIATQIFDSQVPIYIPEVPRNTSSRLAPITIMYWEPENFENLKTLKIILGT